VPTTKEDFAKNTAVSDGTKGWHLTDNYALFAIAAAAEATGKDVHITYSGYDPNWGNGAGYYNTVQIAFFKWA
jgi:hypothetical protein